MAKRRDYRYEQFARALALFIADKTFEQEFKTLADRQANLATLLVNKYVLPHQKVLAKVPEEFTHKSKVICVCDSRVADESNRYDREPSVTYDLGGEYFAPNAIRVSPEHLRIFKQHYIDTREVNRKKVALAEEVDGSVTSAENLEEIKVNWPEVAEQVDALAMQYGVMFQKNLSKLLGRHVEDVKALPAK